MSLLDRVAARLRDRQAPHALIGAAALAAAGIARSTFQPCCFAACSAALTHGTS